MHYTTYSATIEAPFARLWAMLIDKVEHPQRYIAAVEEVKILDKSERGILREMKIPGAILKEIITIDEAAREIKFTLVDHPLFAGDIINKVDLPANSGEPLTLTFTQNWQPLNAEAEKVDPAPMAQAIKNAVLHMKELAEKP